MRTFLKPHVSLQHQVAQKKECQIDIDNFSSKVVRNVTKDSRLAGTGLAHQQHQMVVEAFSCLDGSFYLVLNQVRHIFYLLIGIRILRFIGRFTSFYPLVYFIFFEFPNPFKFKTLLNC